MKKYFCSTFLFILCTTGSFAQTKVTYLDTIAELSCKCINQKDFTDFKTKKARNAQLGICMLQIAKNYKQELLEDYQINLDSLDFYGEQLGKLVGSRMAFTCPNALVKISQIINEDNNVVVEKTWGKVIEITENPYVIFSIRTDGGRQENFYWFQYINSQFDLQNSYKTLKGKMVKIEYSDMEIFDPRINDYRSLHILTSLKIK